jgi:hypothetical protein
MLLIYFAARFMVRSQATKQQRRYERSLRRVRTVKALFDHPARCTDNPSTGVQRSDQPVTRHNHKSMGNKKWCDFRKNWRARNN